MADVSGYTDEQVNRFHRELADSLDRISARIRALLAKAHRNADGTLSGDAFNAALIRELGDQVAAMLGDAFTEAQQRFRDASAGLVELVGADLEEQGLSPQLTDISRGVVQALVGHGVDDLAQVAGEAAPELRNVIRQALTTGSDPEEAMQALADALGKTAAQATSLADTSLMGLDRGVVVAHAEDAGAVGFLFDGPRDTLTRPWCAARVGKAFRSTEEMDREPNDTGPQPPSIYCGGWRCRHRWVALLPGDEANADWFYPA